MVTKQNQFLTLSRESLQTSICPDGQPDDLHTCRDTIKQGYKHSTGIRNNISMTWSACINHHITSHLLHFREQHLHEHFTPSVLPIVCCTAVSTSVIIYIYIYIFHCKFHCMILDCVSKNTEHLFTLHPGRLSGDFNNQYAYHSAVPHVLTFKKTAKLSF